MDHGQFIVLPGKKIKLSDYDPAFTGHFKEKQQAKEQLTRDIKRLAKYQDVLYAQNTYALLIIIQAMDAAGKDSVIKHVMSGINPQGCQVVGFKAPSQEELNHDFLWRCLKELPERGRIGIFNRSYYEDVLIVRVHPHILDARKLPPEMKDKNIWTIRFEDINNVERYLVRNGIVILKFFLHLSKKEQKKRFLKRLNTPEKNWKFSLDDVGERAHWDEYMDAYEDAIDHTSTKWAPWYIIPADHKWFTRAVVAEIIVDTLKSLSLQYPEVKERQKADLAKAREILEKE